MKQKLFEMDKSELKDLISEKSEKLYYGAISLSVITIFLIGIAANNHISFGENNLLNETKKHSFSPIGTETTDTNSYRFTEYEEGVLFGPYILDESRYYVYQGKILDEKGNQVNNAKIKGLHDFYLKTYLDPLFYSPSGQRPVEKNYERFEKDKMLTKYCGMEYDLIPEEYFESLNKNYQSTEEFLRTASYKNADRLLESNLNATKSYSEYISNFLELTQKNISGNNCFRDEETSGIAQATRTPTQYRIDDEVLESHVRMGNKNSKALLRTIEERKEILKGKSSLNITSERIELVNPSQDYEKVISPIDAKDEMNERRLAETRETLNLEEKDDEPEEGSHSHGPETHTHSTEESFDGEEAEDGPVHANQGEDDDTSLTPEQEKFARLVDEEPVQFDLEPFCMERNETPVYGWDKDVYPNIIRGQDILLQDKEAQVRDFFTVSRCPYVEINRLTWYNLDKYYDKVGDKKLSTGYRGDSDDKLERAEEIFLENPGEKTMKQLSESYTHVLKINLRNGEAPIETPYLWERSIQAKSKLDVYEETYDDFYNEEHMKVWDSYFPEPKSNETRRLYNNFLLLESLYALNFFTWSDSIWRLEEKPKRFGGIISRRDG